MKIAEAIEITGGLSAPSKMPGYAYSLPAQECKVGSKLRKIKNSSCSGCYALKGRYTFPLVRNALYKRLNALEHPQWKQAIQTLITKKSPDWFRWHDSGDLQSVIHLRDIVEVASKTPDTKHWLPTREYAIVGNYIALGGEIPDNLTIRMSAHSIDGKPGFGLDLPVSTIHSKNFSYGEEAYVCPAPSQGGVCGSCRACWNKEVKHVSYAKH